MVGSLIRSSNLPHSLQRGVLPILWDISDTLAQNAFLHFYVPAWTIGPPSAWTSGQRWQMRLPLHSTQYCHIWTHPKLLSTSSWWLRPASRLKRAFLTRWHFGNFSASSSFAVVFASKEANSCLILLTLLSCLSLLSRLIGSTFFWLKWIFVKA